MFGYHVHAFSFVTPLDFITTWKTDNVGTSDDDQISIPTEATGSYDCRVDWGDGTSDDITTYDDAAWTHTYAGGAGTYTVTIRGTFRGIKFANGVDKLKLITIEQWGILRLNSTNGYFYGCANLTIPATDPLDLSGVTSLGQAFRGCSVLTEIGGLDRTDTSRVTSFNAMFRQCTVFNQAIPNFNTSSGTDFGNMFQDSAFNQSVASFDTSNATAMNAMFRDTPFNQPVSTFDTSSNAEFNAMFRFAASFDQDISGFDVEAGTTFVSMLDGSGFTQTNYDLLLVAWNAQDLSPNESFDAGTAQYGAGAPAAARANMVLATGSGGDGWSILDGGAA